MIIEFKESQISLGRFLKFCWRPQFIIAAVGGVLLILTALGFENMGFAKDEFGMPASNFREAQFFQGDLFSVKVVPGDHETQFFVVGVKAGELDLENLRMDIVSESESGNGKSSSGKAIPLKRQNDRFVMEGSLEQASRLEIFGRNGKKDRVLLKLKRP